MARKVSDMTVQEASSYFGIPLHELQALVESGQLGWHDPRDNQLYVYAPSIKQAVRDGLLSATSLTLTWSSVTYTLTPERRAALLALMRLLEIDPTSRGSCQQALDLAIDLALETEQLG